MGRSTETTTRRATPGDATRRPPIKVCALCRDNVQWVDYKDLPLLRAHLTDRGQIRARRVTGNCARHQHEIAMAIKTARQLVLLPYAPRPVTKGPVGATEVATEKATALSKLRAGADVNGGVR